MKKTLVLLLLVAAITSLTLNEFHEGDNDKDEKKWG
jgi:hypothetical protein